MLLTFNKYIFRVGDLDGIKIEHAGLLQTSWIALETAW